jgi:hypothetical protein
MAEQAATRRKPPLPGLIAGGLVIMGLMLSTFVAEGWLIVSGLGAFGPGILRELGWLKDQDEFQRQAARRAGYHAYLIGGLATILIIAAVRWNGRDVEVSSEWLVLVLVVMWLTWLFSALLAYWGAPKTASRVLMVFGSFWAVFVLAHFVGALTGSGEPMSLLGVLAGFMFVAPFFGLAYTAGRWPRLTGGLLLVVSAIFLVIVTPRGASSLQWSTILVTAALLIVPLAASGIALLREETE